MIDCARRQADSLTYVDLCSDRGPAHSFAIVVVSISIARAKGGLCTSASHSSGIELNVKRSDEQLLTCTYISAITNNKLAAQCTYCAIDARRDVSW